MFRHVRLVAGMPRSGTSWLAQILDSSPKVRFRMSPLFSWEFKHALDEDSSREEWMRVLQGVYASDNEFMNQTQNRQSGDYPTFTRKEKLPPVLVVKFDRYQNLIERFFELVPDLLGVAIVRHPCGAIHSWLTAPKEFPPDEDPLRHWRAGDAKKREYGDCFGFEDWKWVTRLHLRLASQMPARFRLIRYEALVAHPLDLSREVMDFLRIPWTPQTEDFINASTTRHKPGTYSVYKSPSVAERWRSELQEEIAVAIERDLRGTDLEEFLA